MITNCWTEREYKELAKIYCTCKPIVLHFDRTRHFLECPMQLPVEELLKVERLCPAI